ncbi:MAG: hypothetical protein JNJ45_03325 [Chthonomonas sp.]|nr:hypothetical protein [Chthonomonas sp.]
MFGPTDAATLGDWIKQGRVLPGTTIGDSMLGVYPFVRLLGDLESRA